MKKRTDLDRTIVYVFFLTEWDSDWQGPPVIVEVLETSSTDLSQNGIVNGTNIQGN